MVAENSEFLGRSCAECLKYTWTDQGVSGRDRKYYATVEECKDATGQEPWTRPKGTVPPCFKCEKTDGQRERSYYYAVEPSQRTWLTIRFYDECAAVGDFPHDPIVRRNAGIIFRFRESYRQAKEQALLMRLTMI